MRTSLSGRASRRSAGWAFFLVPTFMFTGMLRNALPQAQTHDVAFAAKFAGVVDQQGFPSHEAWGKALPVRFDSDWQGKNADAHRETEVRVLWTAQALYLRFRCRYRTITVFSDSEPDGRRDQLWDRDVAEVFLQPDSSDPQRYKEFEVSPNGLWIDLGIAPGERHDLHSGLRRRVTFDEKNETWIAELALPMTSLAAHFDPSTAWRVNFYRVEGPTEPRFYSAWRATNTAQPNFHVPAAFGRLIFVVD